MNQFSPQGPKGFLAFFRQPLFWQDSLLLGTMIVLAGCGLIYEYLLSHYAGRVIGMMEMAIYAMMGVMIVSMGLGSFAAKWIKLPFTAFVFLELVIGFLGALSVLVIAWMVSITNLLPQIITDVFALPEGVTPNGDIFLFLQNLAKYFPYFVGALLGFLLGMEIPLIARVRETVYQQRLVHNTGTIYGVDYIGAGIGAALWIALLISMAITKAAGITAAANLAAGLVFLTFYRHHIKYVALLYVLHFLLLFVVFIVIQFGNNWMERMNNLLFQDQVVYSQNTRFQHLTITERAVKNRPDVINLYLNGRLQFSSNDEQIYHSMLVHPAMAATGSTEKVLIIGGGDGLGLREVLRWQPQSVDLVDLDAELVGLFAGSLVSEDLPKDVQTKLVALNENALNDPRVQLHYADAFIHVDELLSQEKLYGVIIVDLPDPNHPDLNKLYTDYFYNKLKYLLRGDGVLVVQSTSPYHAKKAFMAIGKTLKAAGFDAVEQYHQNIPSFGQWGWSIATRYGASASSRLQALDNFAVTGGWLTPALMQASFAFPQGFYDKNNEITVNQLGSNQLYQYHHEAWQRDQGVFYEINQLSTE